MEAEHAAGPGSWSSLVLKVPLRSCAGQHAERLNNKLFFMALPNPPPPSLCPLSADWM